MENQDKASIEKLEARIDAALDGREITPKLERETKLLLQNYTILVQNMGYPNKYKLNLKIETVYTQPPLVHSALYEHNIDSSRERKKVRRLC